jgi:CubicO group peptidase (beta-lactamase class C family)
VLSTLLIVAILLSAWALVRLRVVLAVAAGYKAKVLCTGLFASSRDMDPGRDPQIHDDSYRILRPFSARIDRHARSVTASLVGLAPRTAVYRDGLGATLLPGRDVPANIGQAPAVRMGAGADGWLEASGPPALRRVVDASFEEPDTSRLRRTQAIVVVQDGRVVAERYAPAIRADMPLPGWSMAKSVMNALVGILVADRRLALDQRELLPAWRAPDPRAAITLEDLLRMRSGLRFSEAYGVPWSDVLHMLYDCADAAAFAASRPLAAPPGQVWQYSTGTTNILSLIARRVIGDERYWTWPSRVLFGRIGMRSAVLEPDASGTFVCSSYMVATARDWARYGQLWLDHGRHGDDEVLSDAWIRFSTTPTPQSPDGRYGAHWWLKLNPDIGGDSPAARSIAPDTFFAVGHEGQTLTVMPSKRAVVVRLGASVYIDAWNQAAFTAAIEDAL